MPGDDQIELRNSTADDVAAITEIYAHHVLHGTASFEIEPPDAAEMARRHSEIVSRGLPYIVATEGSKVVGYAYAGPYRPRKAYRFTLEDSVYVDRQYIGRGIGSALLGKLIPTCRASGARELIAVIGDSGNRASIRLHERFGFQHA